MRGLLALILNVGVNAAPMNKQEAVKRLNELRSGSSEGFVIDFDINCNENEDRYCYDSCMYSCVLKSLSKSACEKALPPGCNAVYGGVYTTNVSITMKNPDETFHPDDHEYWGSKGPNSWTIKSHALSSELADIFSRRDVEFTSVLLGIPPAEDPTWQEENAVEDAFFVDQKKRYGVCGFQAAPGAMTMDFETVYNGEVTVKTLSVESNNVVPPNLITAHKGWEKLQGYVGHWENELFKSFNLIPMSPSLFVSDPAFWKELSKGYTLRMQVPDLQPCLVDIPTAGVDVTAILQFVFGERVTGEETGAKMFAERTVDEWGYPLPRTSENCISEEAVTCEACQKLTTSAGTKCQWCMTSQGQSCQTACDQIFARALPCVS